jgi:predicted DCC family thiol-disulfide oxidoreductase YuxK
LSSAAQSVLLYDEDCGFCRWSLDKILAWDRAKRVRPVAIQSEEGSRLLAPIASDARLDSWHLVLDDGKLFSAGAAAEPLARMLPGGRPLAVVFAAFPGVTERAYGFVSRHRSWLARLLRVDANCQVRPRA